MEASLMLIRANHFRQVGPLLPSTFAMKLFAALLLLSVAAAAQSFDSAQSFNAAQSFDAAQTDYWTPRHKMETALVTGFHLADAVQTCWHMSQHKGWYEISPITPNNCPGAAAAVIGEGIALQYGSHKLAQRMRWWRPIDRSLPYVQVGFSIDAIRCSNIRAGCTSFIGIY
jgi:hypothetical protein